jgi:Taurine catabolism dioxygenase TauD, TfdA family
VIGIEGMADEEAFDLLDRLFVHATQPRYLYRHKWSKGDMVLWDNRSVLHQATTDYDMEEYRYLYRVLLGGEAPLAVSQSVPKLSGTPVTQPKTVAGHPEPAPIRAMTADGGSM